MLDVCLCISAEDAHPHRSIELMVDSGRFYTFDVVNEISLEWLVTNSGAHGREVGICWRTDARDLCQLGDVLQPTGHVVHDWLGKNPSRGKWLSALGNQSLGMGIITPAMAVHSSLRLAALRPRAFQLTSREPAMCFAHVL